jgi:hypothetical protein
MKKVWKKPLSLFLILAMVLSVIMIGSVPASADSSQLNTLTSWYQAMDGTNGKTIDLFSNDTSYLLGDQSIKGGSGLTVSNYDSSCPYKGSKVTGWSSASQSMSWNINSTMTGSYYVYALVDQQSGITMSVKDGSNTLNYTMPTSGWDKVQMGEVSIPSGNSSLSLSITSAASSMQFISLELIPASAYSTIESNISNTKSKAVWMESSPVGMMYQWGEWGGNQDGSHATWPGCYANMNWQNFAQTIKNEGADYLVWSITWASTYIAAPIASVDAVYPGRTSSTDYLSQILTDCQNLGIKVIFYYHTGHDETTTWWPAFFNVSSTGYYAQKQNFINSWMNIISEIGNRYGNLLSGWMFDDGGIYYPAPYSMLESAARAGNPDRVVSFNSSYVDGAGPRTNDYDDFYFGEGNTGSAVPYPVDSNGQFTAGPFKSEFDFGNFQTQAGDWGVRLGDTSITCNMAASTFNSIAQNAAQNKMSMAYDFRMWENGGQDSTSLSRFQAAATLANGTYATTGTYINDNNSGIVYNGTWTYSSGRSANDYDHDVHLTDNNNDSFTYNFSSDGTDGIDVIMPGDPGQGDVDIYIDNTYVKTVNTYSYAYVPQQVVYSSSPLSAGSHTLKVVKDNGTYMQLDALKLTTQAINPSSYYEIESAANTNYCLDCSATPADGVIAQTWTYQADDRQQYQFVSCGNGYYNIEVRNNPSYLLDCWTTPNYIVQMWTNTGDDREQFKPVSVGGGNYELVVADNPSLCIQYTGTPANGIALSMGAYTGSSDQQWKLNVVQ